MGERRLTVRDRIIVHLASYIRYAQEFECPEEMSQAGISAAIGKSRAHTTLELSRMKEADLVTDRLAHVKGARSKRKTYYLTHLALAREREIAEHIEGLEIEIGGSGEFNLMNGQQAVEVLMNKLSMSRAIAFNMMLASEGIINLDDMKSQQKPDIGFVAEIDSTPLDQSDSFSQENKTLDACILQANILSKKSRPKEALALIEKAIESHPSNPDISKAYYSRASIFRKLSDFPSALKEINKSLAIANDSDEKLMVGRCQMEKAMIFSGLGNESKSLELLNSANECFEHENSQVDILRCGINHGIILRSMGNIQESMAVLEGALALAEKTSLDRLKAYALVNLTDLLNQQKAYKRSRELGYKSRDIFQVLDEPLLLAASLFNLGTAQSGLGDREEAISNLDSAILILEKNDMLISRTDWLEKYADILEELGEADKAKSILEKF